MSDIRKWIGRTVLCLFAAPFSGLALAQDNVVNIAVAGAMTGPYAEYGVAIERGVRLAIDKWNGQGGIDGKKIVLKHHLDAGVSPDRGVAAMRQILSDPTVVGIMGPGGSSINLAIRPMMVADGRPYINSQAQDPAAFYENEGTGAPYKNMFTTALPSNVEASFLGAELATKYKSIGIMHESSAYGATGAKLMAEEIKKQKPSSIVVLESYDWGTKDVTAQLSRLKKENIEVLAVVGLGADMATIRKNMARLNFKPKFYASAGALSPSYANNAGDLVLGTLAPGMASLGERPLGEKAKEFADAYKAKHGTDSIWGNDPTYPQISMGALSATAYDGANLMFEAIRVAKTFDKEKIVSALEGIQGYKGVNSTYTFSKSNHTGISTENLAFFEYVLEGGKMITKMVKK